MLPQSERHGIEASLHLAEECPRRLHLQAVHLVGVSFVNCGPLTSILCLI